MIFGVDGENNGVSSRHKGLLLKWEGNPSADPAHRVEAEKVSAGSWNGRCGPHFVGRMEPGVGLDDMTMGGAYHLARGDSGFLSGERVCYIQRGEVLALKLVLVEKYGHLFRVGTEGFDTLGSFYA